MRPGRCVRSWALGHRLVPCPRHPRCVGATRALIVLALTALAVPASAQPPAPTLVILVRHAEKATLPADDPDLSPAGQARAKALTTTLESSGVDVIITTEFRRTRETAAPLAAARHLQPIVVHSSDDTAAHARAVAAEIARHPGHTILVVGHSQHRTGHRGGTRWSDAGRASARIASRRSCC